MRWPDAGPGTVLSLRSTDGARLLVRREWPVLPVDAVVELAAARVPTDARRLSMLAHPRVATHSLQAATLARRACGWARRSTRGRVSTIVRGERDRPVFRSRASIPVDLNLTHGGGVVAVAFDPRGPIGVDVEPSRTPTAALLANTVRPEELPWLDGAFDATDRAFRYARLWTLKEALMKCTGLGLALDPRDLAFRICGRRAELVRSPLRGAWSFETFVVDGRVPCTVCRGRPGQAS
jgi:phosphopantetheinyl transferase